MVGVVRFGMVWYDMVVVVCNGNEMSLVAVCVMMRSPLWVNMSCFPELFCIVDVVVVVVVVVVGGCK